MNFNEPTIDDIKKFADEKRKSRAIPAKKTRQPRQSKIKEPEPEPEPPIEDEEDEEEEIIEPIKVKKQIIKKQPKKSKKMIIVEDEDEDTEEEEEPIVIKSSNKRGNRNNQNQETFKDIYESINNIKDLINTQKEVIIEAVKPKVPIEEPKKTKAKPKPKPKPKKVEKTLDLTIPDKEIEQIISGNKTQVKNTDPKLQAFLDAFKR